MSRDPPNFIEVMLLMCREAMEKDKDRPAVSTSVVPLVDFIDDFPQKPSGLSR